MVLLPGPHHSVPVGNTGPAWWIYQTPNPATALGECNDKFQIGKTKRSPTWSFFFSFFLPPDVPDSAFRREAQPYSGLALLRTSVHPPRHNYMGLSFVDVDR